MTLVRLQDILGESAESIYNFEGTDKERQKIMERCDMVARLAKQMINNADVILRTDKLKAEGKLRNATIERVVGIDEEDDEKQ